MTNEVNNDIIYQERSKQILKNKLYVITDVLTPILSTSGMITATNERLESIFLVLTIFSLTLSVMTRVVMMIKRLHDKYKKAKEDGKITKEELDEMLDIVTSEYEAIKGSSEFNELFENVDKIKGKNKGE